MPAGRMRGHTVRSTRRLRPTAPASRGGGPLCPLRWASLRNHRRPGPQTSTTGGRGSVRAAAGLTPTPHRPQVPPTAPRGGGPPCPLPCAPNRKPPPQRAANASEPKTPHVIQSKDTARSTIHRHPPSRLRPVLTRNRAILGRYSAPILTNRGLPLQDLAWVDALGAWPTNHDLPLKGRWAKPIQICSLPIGAELSRQTPIGADTEVRPPATLSLAPGARCARMNAQRTGAKPIQVCSLPSGTSVSRQIPIGRTQRSALPPRDCRVHSNGGLGLDAQRLRNSELDSATAHSVR